MTLTVKPHLEKYIEEQVNAGRFSSAVELVEAGIARLMLDPMPDGVDDDDLRRLLVSIEQDERGEVIDGRILHAQIRRLFIDKQS